MCLLLRHTKADTGLCAAAAAADPAPTSGTRSADKLIDSSLSYIPFVFILPSLQRLRLNSISAWCAEHPKKMLDLGSLAAVTSLRVLELEGTDVYLHYLAQLTQLEALVLTDVAHPAGAKASSLHIPVSLTRLELQTSDWEDPADVGSIPMSDLAMPKLQTFKGHLLSLTLDPHFLCEMKGPSHLSALACLQQLTELKLGSVRGTPVDGQLAFSCLQSLHLEMVEWPAGQHPQWGLAGCPALQTLSLDLRVNEPKETCRLDLRGITSCLASTLIVNMLDVNDDMRAIADFSGWLLKEVDIACGTYKGRWYAEQSVRDLLGALVGHVEFSNVFMDGKRQG